MSQDKNDKSLEKSFIKDNFQWMLGMSYPVIFASLLLFFTSDHPWSIIKFIWGAYLSLMFFYLALHIKAFRWIVALIYGLALIAYIFSGGSGRGCSRIAPHLC